MTGVEYPVVTVGGKEYTVKFSMLSEYFLSMIGVSLHSLLPVGHPGRLVQRMQLFGAAVADSFPEPAKAPGAIKWAAQISREEWPAIDAAIDEALKKAMEESQTGTQAVTPLSESLAS
jgi:hypothetical protein